jgi:hypothetical protein
MQAEKLTNDLFGSGSKEDSISSRRCWTNGTTQRASFIRFALTTETSTFFNNEHRRLMGYGIWFRFARQQRGLTHEMAGLPACRATMRGLSEFYSTATFVPFGA